MNKDKYVCKTVSIREDIWKKFLTLRGTWLIKNNIDVNFTEYVNITLEKQLQDDLKEC